MKSSLTVDVCEICELCRHHVKTAAGQPHVKYSKWLRQDGEWSLFLSETPPPCGKPPSLR